MTSQTGQQRITKQILPKISRNKVNQAVKFSQLIIECNMKNIFLEKSYTKYGGEASPRDYKIKYISWLTV